MQPVISVHQVYFYRRRRAILQNVSLQLYPNEVVALVGSNGTGKTTLLEIIAGILTADRGEIRYSPTLPDFWLGYLPDKAPLYPEWRVNEFLTRCAAMRGVTAVHQAVEKVIRDCCLTPVATAQCKQLSHGYRQRVGLAQALIHYPATVILDEPTNGLDNSQKLSLRPLLAGLKNTCTVLMTSHDYEEILATADRVYRLTAGTVQEIPLPKRDTAQIWVACGSAENAHQLAGTKGVADGRFVGFVYDGTAAARRQLWQQLSADQTVNALYSAYPALALQEKLDNVA